MPQSVVDVVLPRLVRPAEELGQAIGTQIEELLRGFRPGSVPQPKSQDQRVLPEAEVAMGNAGRVMMVV
jgi:hypothetical protein